MIHTAPRRKGSLSKYLKQYTHLPDLTARLDNLPDEPFSQATVNEIVLWKVNRYATVPPGVRKGLYPIRTLSPKERSKWLPLNANVAVCAVRDRAQSRSAASIRIQSRWLHCQVQNRMLIRRRRIRNARCDWSLSSLVDADTRVALRRRRLWK
jgi:hypothetical protein